MNKRYGVAWHGDRRDVGILTRGFVSGRKPKEHTFLIVTERCFFALIPFADFRSPGQIQLILVQSLTLRFLGGFCFVLRSLLSDGLFLFFACVLDSSSRLTNPKRRNAREYNLRCLIASSKLHHDTFCAFAVE